MTLAGPPLYVRRAAASIRAIAAFVASSAYFLPWHVVDPSHEDWSGAFCWGPDCPAPAPPQSAPRVIVHEPVYTCTGWSHAHQVDPLLILAVIVALSLVSLRRSRIGFALLVAVAGIGAAVAEFYALFDLSHMFDKVRSLPGEHVFQGAFVVLALTTLFDWVSAPLLYLWARARLAR